MKVQRGGLWRGARASYLAAAVEGLAAVLVLRWALAALGPERYGAWVALASAVAWVGLADLGLGHALLNAGAGAAAAGDERSLARLHATSTAWLGLLGLALGALAVMGLRALDLAALLGAPSGLAGELRDAATVVAVLGALRLPLAGAAALAAGAGGLHRVRAFQAVGALAQIAGAWAGLALELGTVGFAAVVMGGQLLGQVLAVADLAWRERWARVRLGDISRARLRTLVAPSRDFFLLQVALLVILSTDNLVIALALGAGEVPAYAVPHRLAMIPASLLTVFTTAAWPVLAAQHARGETAALAASWSAMVRVTGVLALGAALVVGLFGRDLGAIWVGDEVPISTGVGAAMAAFSFLFVVESGSAVLLNAIGRTSGQVRCALAAAVLNLGFSVLLVRPFGVVGVALGTLLASLASTAWWVPRAAAQALGGDGWSPWRNAARRWLGPGIGTLLVGLALERWVTGHWPRAASAAALGLFHVALAWRLALEPAERNLALAWSGWKQAKGPEVR